jgi:P4 family phage/plasmid primase-like protien
MSDEERVAALREHMNRVFIGGKRYSEIFKIAPDDNGRYMRQPIDRRAAPEICDRTLYETESELDRLDEPVAPPPASAIPKVSTTQPEPLEARPIANLSDAELRQLKAENALALNADRMQRERLELEWLAAIGAQAEGEARVENRMHRAEQLQLERLVGEGKPEQARPAHASTTERAPALEAPEPSVAPTAGSVEDEALRHLIGDIISTIDRANESEPIHDFPMDEAGNAQALARYVGGKIWISTPGRGDLVYDRTHGLFRSDFAAPVVLAAAGRIARLRADLGGLPPDEWKACAAFAAKSATKQSLMAVIALASKSLEVFRLDKQLDAAGDWINCDGLAVPLRLGLDYLRPSEPADLFTRSTCRIERGPTPVFDAFMDLASNHRPDWIAWQMRYFGYALTGDTSAAFFPWWYGPGRNLKGTNERLLKRTHGSYFATIATSVVLEIKNEGTGPRPDLVDLDGPRIGGAQEVPEGRLNVQSVKTLTGNGDSINAARKFKDPTTFTPVIKPFMTSNNEPGLTHVDQAIRARIRKVPYDYTLSQDEIDPTFEDKLGAEAPRILAKFIDEAVEYYRLGCGPRAFPKSVTIDASSTEYLLAQDVVGQWLEARVIRVGTTTAKALYADFVAWTAEGGLLSKTQAAFGRELIASGFKRGKDEKKHATYNEISLIPSPPKDRKNLDDNKMDGMEGMDPNSQKVSHDACIEKLPGKDLPTTPTTPELFQKETFPENPSNYSNHSEPSSGLAPAEALDESSPSSDSPPSVPTSERLDEDSDEALILQVKDLLELDKIPNPTQHAYALRVVTRGSPLSEIERAIMQEIIEARR